MDYSAPTYSTLLHSVEKPGKWEHIKDLDFFFSRSYRYHRGHGFFCLFLNRILNLCRFIFIVCLTTYLVYGINYSVLFDNYDDSSAAVPNPMIFQLSKPEQSDINLAEIFLPLNTTFDNFTSSTWIVLKVASAVCICLFIGICYQMAYFWDIKQFFNVRLEIRDSALGNLTWKETMKRIIDVQPEEKMCVQKKVLTELDFSSRILRKQNYFIAMVKQGLLPLRFNIPFLGEIVYWTRDLEWTTRVLLFSWSFSAYKSVGVLREDYRIQGERRRVVRLLCLKIIVFLLLSPLFATISIVLIMWEVLRYAETIQREPGEIGIRNWSKYARIYLRHYNEMEEELNVRLAKAQGPAAKYLLSPNSTPVMTEIAKFLGFLSHSFLVVVGLLVLFDKDVLRVQFIVALFTVLVFLATTCRKAVLGEVEALEDPKKLLQDVVEHTHHQPSVWLRISDKKEMQQLYQLRVVAVLERLLSPFMTICWLVFLLCHPSRLRDIVDFIGTFTVSMEGMGDVCSFTILDFMKHGTPKPRRQATFNDREKCVYEFTAEQASRLDSSSDTEQAEKIPKTTGVSNMLIRSNVSEKIPLLPVRH